MFESIVTKIDEALTEQQVFVPKPVEAALSAIEKPSALEQANAEIERLKAEKVAAEAQHESSVRDLKLKTVVDAARRPAAAAKLNNGTQEVQIAQARNACGGNARWNMLSPQQRCEALNISGFDQTSPKTVKQFFGPGSSAADASRLAKENPAEYRRLRGIARVTGIL